MCRDLGCWPHLGATLVGVPSTTVSRQRLNALLAAQDHVLHRRQAYALGMTRDGIAHRERFAGWQELLRNVFLSHPGEPSHRQRLVAALLYGGPDVAVDADDACVFHGVRAVRPSDDVVRIVGPAMSTARSHSFVVVRRTRAEFDVVRTDLLRYVDPATAAIASARLRRDPRRVLAILSDVVQRRIAGVDALVRAHVRASPRNARPTDLALRQLRSGVHSVGEADFRLLAEASAVLPPLLYNPLLRLPDGRLISPDALAVDAGLVHEVNGRSTHAREDLFVDMQVRHDTMTVAGLVVLHNAPARLVREPRQVINEFERCYLRLAGCGLPDGVRLVRPAVSAA
ncbi:MAG: hypothetical protein QOD07_2886 [Frankiaceae bacterium]|nr:hypothetical protein [Frankiaceae bacterium]